MVLPSAIFFDLDDTIISFDGASDRAWEDVCGIYSEKYGYCEAGAFLDCINSVRSWYWSDPDRFKAGRMDLLGALRTVIKMALEKLNCLNMEHVFEIAEHYAKLQYSGVCLFPDSVRTLENLKNKGFKLAVITNGTSEEQRDKLVRFDLLKYFDICLIEQEVGFGKPDTRVFEMAMEHLKLKPEEAWMIGDNLEWDVEAPQKLGIFSIWNDYTKKGLSSDSRVKPDGIVNSIAGLEKLLY